MVMDGGHTTRCHHPNLVLAVRAPQLGALSAAHTDAPMTGYSWAEARVKIARMTLTIKLDRNWRSFQLANSAPPLSVTDSAIAPSARIPCAHPRAHAERSRPATMLSGTPAHAASRWVCGGCRRATPCVGGSSQACHRLRNTAMDDSIGGS